MVNPPELLTSDQAGIPLRGLIKRLAKEFPLVREWELLVSAKCFAGDQNGWNGSSSSAGACRPDGDHPSRLQPIPQQRQAAMPSQLRRPG